MIFFCEAHQLMHYIWSFFFVVVWPLSRKKFLGRSTSPMLPVCPFKCIYLCICALFSVATSVNMNFYIEQKVLFKRLDELYRLVPHLTSMDACYWSYGHYSLDGQDGWKKSVDFFHFFFAFIVNRPWKKRFVQQKLRFKPYSSRYDAPMVLQWSKPRKLKK
jgi:hypothetical protein